MKLARNRQYTVRLMAPFNMRCKTCGEYIYKGKKFNARKEDVEGDTYLGIRIYRFYIKCTRCLQEISFKTDPQNTDYEIEAGATRNFMALKLAEEQAKREEDEEKEEEASNQMKLLEKRTQQSKREMDVLESLEELKDLNRRQQTVNYEQMLEKYDNSAEIMRTEKEQEEYDEQLVKEIFKNKRKLTGKIVEVETVEIEEEENLVEQNKKLKTTLAPAPSKPKISIEEKRKKFGIVVKKKTNDKKEEKAESASNSKEEEKITSNCEISKSSKNSFSSQPGGLALLGAYSGSDSENEDE